MCSSTPFQDTELENYYLELALNELPELGWPTLFPRGVVAPHHKLFSMDCFPLEFETWTNISPPPSPVSPPPSEPHPLQARLTLPSKQFCEETTSQEIGITLIYGDGEESAGKIDVDRLMAIVEVITGPDKVAETGQNRDFNDPLSHPHPQSNANKVNEPRLEQTSEQVSDQEVNPSLSLPPTYKDKPTPIIKNGLNTRKSGFLQDLPERKLRFLNLSQIRSIKDRPLFRSFTERSQVTVETSPSSNWTGKQPSSHPDERRPQRKLRFLKLASLHPNPSVLGLEQSLALQKSLPGSRTRNLTLHKGPCKGPTPKYKCHRCLYKFLLPK